MEGNETKRRKRGRKQNLRRSFVALLLAAVLMQGASLGAAAGLETGNGNLAENEDAAGTNLVTTEVTGIVAESSEDISEIPDAAEENAGIVTASRNILILKLYQEDELVQEEKLERGSVSCNLTTLQKEGYLFGGYLYQDRLVLDADGFVTDALEDLWNAEASEEYFALSANWVPKVYTLFYGEDADKDGIPDQNVQVTYGESYGNLEPMPDKGLSVFKGYYYGKKQVFDRKGTAKESWIWDGEETIILKAKYYRPAGNDLWGDGGSEAGTASGTDASASVQNTQQDDQQGNAAGETQENGADGTGMTQGNGSEDLPEESADGGTAELTEEAQDTLLENGAGTGKDALLASSAGAGQENLLESGAGTDMETLPQYSTEEDGSLRLKREADGEQSTLENMSASENKVILGGHFIYPTDGTAGSTENGTEEDRSEANRKQANGNNESTEPGLDQSADGLSASKKENKFKVRLEELSDHVTEKLNLKNPAAGKAIVLGAFTVCSCIALAALLLCWHLLQNSATLYTVDASGRKKRIVFLLLRKGEHGYGLVIAQEHLDESETGTYLLSLPALFVHKNRNENILITTPSKKWSELVAKEISFLAYGE